MTPFTHSGRIDGRLAVAALLALTLLAPTGSAAQSGQERTAKGATPQAVSPGSKVAAEMLAESCPTFSWSEVDGASRYELVLYRVDEADDPETELHRQVPEGVGSWTPSAAQCPASEGSRYAWAVRALGRDGAGAWSEPLLFQTPGAPTDDEVRQALATLRRHREGPAARDRAGGAPSPPATDHQQPATAPHALPSTTASATLSPRAVTAPEGFSLSISGDLDLGGFVFKYGDPFLHNDGGIAANNTAVGRKALESVTPFSPSSSSGKDNSALGSGALLSNTTGSGNTAIGSGALISNTEGKITRRVGPSPCSPTARVPATRRSGSPRSLPTPRVTTTLQRVGMPWAPTLGVITTPRSGTGRSGTTPRA